MTFSPSNPALPPDQLGDKFTIETPEQTSLEFALAGIGSRFLALAVDSLIQTGISAVVAATGVGLIFAFGRESLSGLWIGGTIVILFFLISYGYFMLFEGLWNGQTPGKRVIHIRVLKEDGRPIRMTESVGRNLLRIVDSLPFLYAVGIASVLLSKRSKRLGDFVAGTIVVHERPLEDIRPVWEASAKDDGVRLGSERLTPEELALVDAFLNRRDALDPGLRYNTAVQILKRLQPKLHIPEGVNFRNEELLEMISRERRRSAQYK